MKNQRERSRAAVVDGDIGTVDRQPALVKRGIGSEQFAEQPHQRGFADAGTRFLAMRPGEFMRAAERPDTLA